MPHTLLAQELRRLVGAGVCGLRIQPPVTGPLDDPAATGLWQAAAELGIAIDVNLAQDDYHQVAARAAEFPTVPIILDHCGWLVGRDPQTRGRPSAPLSPCPDTLIP